MAVAALEALKILKSEPERRRRLAELVRLASEAASLQGVSPSGSQILPVIVGADQRALSLATALQSRGFDVRAIRPPSVPEGTARLRISITLNVDEKRIARLFDALAEEWLATASLAVTDDVERRTGDWKPSRSNLSTYEGVFNISAGHQRNEEYQ
jgi:8-amino-7-oxononanoate synthase